MMSPVSHTPSLRRAPVQRRSAERLARILDACAGLLDEVGYDDLSTRAVAERAGVPIGSVYRFFSNKRQMADALAQRNLERFTERVTERLTATGDRGWRHAMDAVLDTYLDMKRTAPASPSSTSATRYRSAPAAPSRITGSPTGSPRCSPTTSAAPPTTTCAAPSWSPWRPPTPWSTWRSG